MKYLILGAGPAGLTVANKLLLSGEDSFLVLEKESEAGGLCRSTDVDGSPFDIGGGHFLDVRRPKVNEFLFGFMPEEEWDLYDRKTTLHVNGNVIGQPIEANIWQMKLEDQVEYLKSIAVAGCNLGEPMPEKFVDWIYWKLGKKIAEDYMLPYNRKMFGKNLDELGTYWLEKLPNVSFDETLLSCLEKKPYGKDPGHTQFYYPKKYGYGELWKRMADSLGDRIVYNTAISSIDFDSRTVTSTEGEKYTADVIITTIPWLEFADISGMPDELVRDIKRLKYSSIQTEYHPENLDTESQWVYYPDPKLSYHRILVRHNFCPGSRGYWTETNKERIDAVSSNENFKYMNKYAYPLNTVDKPQIMDRLLKWSSERRVYGLGRWGEHQHYNSDVTVEKAFGLFESLS
ncbi:amine oxidoreductase [Butyrivibrio sp. CB08]|uniref:protoporphyrinogen/coproporphyrinogen oxidase n=1 Tax=Butyrivibrio sp. CB08 TaxID=2364879 RepID=UPI000EA99FF9|nr:FAD-dependent oxidoreductase [Butyrivibrio sp. CB08]RKM57812.1 amine oxidoreductase [Butyrivibrio sp. CB08]